MDKVPEGPGLSVHLEGGRVWPYTKVRAAGVLLGGVRDGTQIQPGWWHWHPAYRLFPTTTAGKCTGYKALLEAT